MTINLEKSILVALKDQVELTGDLIAAVKGLKLQTTVNVPRQEFPKIEAQQVPIVNVETKAPIVNFTSPTQPAAKIIMNEAREITIDFDRDILGRIKPPLRIISRPIK